MRLTTVARMGMTPGTVYRHRARVVPLPDADLPPSFDQRRHIELGRRPGSWMALAFRLPFPAGRGQIERAWAAVVRRHGTLRTVVDDSSGEVRLQRVGWQPAGWEAVAPDSGRDPRELLREIFDTACDPFAEPSHQLCVVEPVDASEAPRVVIGLDHSHTDAWSLLVLLRDFCSCLDDVVNGLEPGTCLPTPADFADHTAELASRPPAPEEVRRRWAQIMADGQGEMPVFPLELGDVTRPRPEVVEVRDIVDDRGVAGLERCAEAAGVRMLPLALSEMAASLRRHSGAPLRAVLPVHSRIGPPGDPRRWHDSVGWFITNAVVECTDPDPVACARDVKAAVALGSYPLEPLLAPYGGMPHTPGMFAISWLDNRRLPVEVDLSLEPQHVSATILTTGVMVWFVVGPTGLHLRCRYPDTPQARVSVGAWLDEVCAGLRHRAGVGTVTEPIGDGAAAPVAVGRRGGTGA